MTQTMSNTMKMKRQLFTLLLMLLSLACLQAQIRWEAAYLDTTWNDLAVSGMEVSGNRLLYHFAAQGIAGEEFRKYTLLLGEKGEILALDTAAQNLQSVTGPYFFPLQGNMARMLGYWVVLDTARLFNVVIDDSLNHFWQGYVEVPYAGYTLMEGDSNVVVARDDHCGLKFYKAKLDGTVFWEKSYEETDLGNCAGYLETVSMIETGDGGYLAGMIFRDFFPDTYYLYVLKIDAGGELEWKFKRTTDVILTPSLAKTGGFAYVLQNNKLFKISASGDAVCEKNLASGNNSPLAAGHVVRSLAATGGSDLLLTGKTPFSNSHKGNVFLAKMDTSAQLVSYTDFGRNSVPEEGLKVSQLSDGGFLIIGKRYATTAAGSPGDAYFIRTDSTGNSASNVIRGRVFYDKNANCQADPGEPGLVGINLRVTGPGRPLYDRSDAAGEFSFLVREGVATIAMDETNPYLKPCWASSIFVAAQFDTFTINFPVKPTAFCPLLKVSIASPPLRSCQENYYQVAYRNDGTAPAEDVMIRVEMDAAFENILPELSFTEPVPGIYEFALGDLPEGSAGTFKIYFDLGCDVPAGTEHCISATISPHDYCTTDPVFLADPPHVATDCKTNTGTQVSVLRKSWKSGTENNIGRDSTLEYYIHFQNVTGNSVSKVVVLDTIFAHLLPLTTELVQSSHPCTFELLEGGVARFTFDNINLPDSLTNMQDSYGFVQFSVAQKPSLPRNIIITNKAWVSMDGTAAVPTNQLSQKVDFPDVYHVIDTTICRGDKIFGFRVFSDSVLQKILQLTNVDSIIVVHAKVEGSLTENYETVLPGTEFMGVVINQDMTVKEVYELANGCDSIVLTHFEVVSGSRETGELLAAVSLFPNPASDWLAVKILVPEAGEVSVSVYNALGQKTAMPLAESWQPAGELRLDVSLKGWPPGMYWVEVKTKKGRLVRKLIVPT